MNKGSGWNKWGLHLHTVYSHTNSKYNCTMKEIAAKIKAEGLRVVGVTNYFLVEEKEIEELKAELGEDVYLIPNFEFRITEKNKDGEFINVHVLFNPDTTSIKKIHESLSRIELANIAGTSKVYCTLDQIKRQGTESITVTLKDLVDQLNRDFKAIDDFLIVGVNKGYGGFYPGGKQRDIEFAEKMDTLSHFIFSSKVDVDFFLNKVEGRSALNLPPKAVIECCDAHTINDIGKKYTWIKGEPTFEGLKQILFEPFHRVSISEAIPREPLRKIESIKFNFPTNSVIQKVGSSDQQQLCITHLKDEILFSPNFTCLIGGRGTGKSTIINILAERLGIETDFFNNQNNQIKIDNKVFDFKNDSSNIIEIKGTEEIEFVSQGRIEKLAEGDELTKLVFNERIKDSEVDFLELEKSFISFVNLLDNNVKLNFELQEQRNLLRDKEKELSNSQKIVDSEKDPKYKEISDAIEKCQTEISLLEFSKKEYSKLVSKLKDVVNDTILNGSDNEYEQRINEIINSILSFQELNRKDNEITILLTEYGNTDEILKLKGQQLEIESEKLKEFFKEKGTSEESIKDAQKAAENVSRLAQIIYGINIRIETIIAKGKENNSNVSGIKDNYNKTEKLIKERIGIINDRLKPKNKNENVQEIKFEYEFNFESYQNSLFDEFYKTFSAYHLPNVQVDKVKEVLFLIKPEESLLEKNADDFIKLLDSQIDTNGYNRTNLYVKIVSNIFSVKANYSIYRALLQKHIYNLTKYLKIKGYYGDRELNACSFGQRCTAVIVTLLMTGVKPLVIDEPEAHLDNRLIADYLIELIKAKKLDRQIIFATHNSNFVVNGDAELVHILEIPDKDLYTKIHSTTIEDLDKRPKLLKLEGGKEAFLNRENKYGLNRSK